MYAQFYGEVSESGGDDMKRKMVLPFLIGYVGSAGILYLFFSSLYVSLLGSLPSAVLYMKYQKARRSEKEKWKLMTEFKDAMDSMISALVAGYSMENAVKEAYKDLLLMYDEKAGILLELKDIMQKLTLKRPLSELLLDLGRRSDVEDIVTFSQIYGIARRSGGNLVKVMKRTADNIGEKMEVQREIQTMIAGKRMEAMCMMIIPLGIIVYLRIFSPGFLDPLYQGVMGRLVMTVALIVYLVAVFWSNKIMDIKC